MSKNSIHSCPCGSGERYENCCEKYISYNEYPETAEQLMRSRFTAYTLKNEQYILSSWHASTRPAEINLDKDNSEWKKLKIISSANNHVVFVAYFSTHDPELKQDKLFALYEESDFLKEDHWFYLSGKNLETIRLSKNMSCPCRSGKKFKRCCGADL